MDERQNRVLNLEPISSSFLVEDILRRGATSVFESPMENPSEKIKNENEIDVHTGMGYDALTASSGNQGFTGLSCMVAEAEIKGAREFAKGIYLLIRSKIVRCDGCEGVFSKTKFPIQETHSTIVKAF